VIYDTMTVAENLLPVEEPPACRARRSTWRVAEVAENAGLTGDLRRRAAA